MNNATQSEPPPAELPQPERLARAGTGKVDGAARLAEIYKGARHHIAADPSIDC